MRGGGSKPGERRGGRQRGTPNKVNAQERAEIAASGELPLDYMLRVMRDDTVDPERRDHMARSAAPYLHAKPQAVVQPDESKGPPTISIVQLSDLPGDISAPGFERNPNGRAKGA
jgi:hypothetical protein